jgi:TolA-binding protein
MPRARAWGGPRRVALLAILFALVGASGCAFFNTYTNARRFFREADNAPLGPDGRVTPTARKAYDTSIEKCKKLLDLYPDSKWVDDTLYLMSRAYFGKAEYGSCLRRLDELDERFPEHDWQEPVLYMRGVCLLEDGDEAQAIAVLERLQERYPKSEYLAEGMYRRGEAEYRLHNWAAAEDAYQRLLDGVGDSDFHDAARLKIALAQRELGQDSLAVTSLAALAAVGRDRRKVFEGQLTAAEILLEQRRLAECAALLGELEPVSENFQSRAQVLLLQARVAEAEERYDEAMLQFENVATEFPKSNPAAEAWYRIGLIRQNRQGDLEQAIQAYDQSTKEVPRSLFGDLAASKRRAAQEVLDVQARFGSMPADSLGGEREGLQFRLAENQFLRLENPQDALVAYTELLEEYPTSPLAPQAAYAIAYLNRYSLADSAATQAAVVLLLHRYPDSEAAAFVGGWPAALGFEVPPPTAPPVQIVQRQTAPPPALSDSLQVDPPSGRPDTLRAAPMPGRPDTLRVAPMPGRPDTLRVAPMPGQPDTLRAAPPSALPDTLRAAPPSVLPDTLSANGEADSLEPPEPRDEP